MHPLTEMMLPIFRLLSPGLDYTKIKALAKEFRLEGEPMQNLPDGGIRISRGTRHLEATPDKRYWYADDSKLWNPASRPTSLPKDVDARDAAFALIRRLGMTPQSGPGVIVIPAVGAIGRTKTDSASLQPGDVITRHGGADLDVYVGIGITLEIPNTAGGGAIRAEAQGKATKLGVVFGEGGEVIAFNASWQDIESVLRVVPALPPVAPQAAFDGKTKRTAVVDPTSAQLIYRHTIVQEPEQDEVACLCPYWLFRVVGQHADRNFPCADVATPAAEFVPRRVATMAEVYAGRDKYSKPEPSTGVRSMGISWQTDGNPHGDASVAAVIKEAANLNWQVRYAWRDQDAWESDWNAESATWVDDVDLAFYNGHAYWDGWQLADRLQMAKHIFVTPATTGSDDTERRLWSAKLRWIIIAACGPLQDDLITQKDDDAFRWAGAFDGFRLLLGFATDTAGFAIESVRALELSGRGVPLARAWLRAAREEQPFLSLQGAGSGTPKRWSAALAAESATESALDDVLPHGAQPAPGPLRASRLRAIWTPA